MDERQVAKVDPLLGLLHMDLLRRIAYLLGMARAPGAIAPLLCVLIRCVWGRRVDGCSLSFVRRSLSSQSRLCILFPALLFQDC